MIRLIKGFGLRSFVIRTRPNEKRDGVKVLWCFYDVVCMVILEIFVGQGSTFLFERNERVEISDFPMFNGEL